MTQPALVTRLHSTSLASLSETDRARAIARLTDEQAQALLYDWPFWARESQLPPPGDWRTWLVLAGRGFGKTRTGGEWVRHQAETGACRRMALVAPTAADARDTMVEGESGILAIAPPTNRPLYEPSKRRLTWRNGAIATLYSADEPDRLRGPQSDGAWCDELASWRHPEAFDMLLFGLRLGDDPRVVVTTTPRPTKEIRTMMADPTCTITRGSTYDNRSNLAGVFYDQIVARYEGTRLGRQELYAEILDDNPGALWRRADIDDYRVTAAPELTRIVVAVDPAGSSSENAADTGIVVAGVAHNGHGYVLDDMSVHGSPNEWGKQAVAAYSKYRADRVVAENNFGGEMVQFTIRTVNANVAYKDVHASRGKTIRAEPVSALYEQGRVHHVGTFAELEDQLCQWEPGMKSPDRLDALVWALTELMVAEPAYQCGTSRYA